MMTQNTGWSLYPLLHRGNWRKNPASETFLSVRTTYTPLGVEPGQP